MNKSGNPNTPEMPVEALAPGVDVLGDSSLAQSRKPGRPATGRSTEAFTVRLRLKDAAELRRRAKGARIPVAEFVRKTILHEIRHRPSRYGKKSRKQRSYHATYRQRLP
jgi:hypothetical protein